MGEKSTNQFKSKLGHAKGLGPAGHGTSHWWAQRLTAIALIPLSVWFVSSLLTALMFPTPGLVAEWMASPITAILLGLLVITTFIHAYLGLQVVIEDYVKCEFKKYGLLISIKFLSILFAAACLLAIIRLHVLDTALTL